MKGGLPLTPHPRRPPSGAGLMLRAVPRLQQRGSGSGVSPPMRSSSDAMGTVSRFYRGRRIVAVQLDGTWQIVAHGYTGAIARTNIKSLSLAEVMGQAEWVVETRFAFRPLSQDVHMAG